MTRDELVKALTDATSLVLSAGNGAISFDQFLEAYDNFFYRYALDGREADPEPRLLSEMQWAIEFHRQIQEETLNPLYAAGDRDTPYLNSIGRIDPQQAKNRLSELCRELGAREVLRRLSS